MVLTMPSWMPWLHYNRMMGKTPYGNQAQTMRGLQRKWWSNVNSVLQRCTRHDLGRESSSTKFGNGKNNLAARLPTNPPFRFICGLVTWTLYHGWRFIQCGKKYSSVCTKMVWSIVASVWWTGTLNCKLPFLTLKLESKGRKRFIVAL